MENSMKANCLGCRKQFILRRNPKQKFCNLPACQNIRKNLWRNQKLSLDIDYKENRNAAAKRWRNKNNDYWKKYRASKLLANANNITSKFNASLFASNNANSDALQIMLAQRITIKSGIYSVYIKNDSFANSDALP